MEELLMEILKGTREYKINKKRPYLEQAARGIGTKAYVTKRIDMLREQLLELKKKINS